MLILFCLLCFSCIKSLHKRRSVEHYWMQLCAGWPSKTSCSYQRNCPVLFFSKPKLTLCTEASFNPFFHISFHQHSFSAYIVDRRICQIGVKEGLRSFVYLFLGFFFCCYSVFFEPYVVPFILVSESRHQKNVIWTTSGD